MAVQVLLAFDDGATADAVQRNLARAGIQSSKQVGSQAVNFGMKLGPIEASAEELLLVLEATPDIADTLFDLVARVKARLFVNKQEIPVNNKEALQRALANSKSIIEPPTFKKMFGRNNSS